MESKQSGITFLNSSYQNNSLLIKKRVGTPRSTSLYGISRYDGDSYDAYNDYRNYNNRYSSQFPEEYPGPRKMTSIVERRSPSMDKDEIRDNFSTVLREKMPNNEIFNSNESWLCDVDIFREKMRAKHLLSVSNQRQTLSRYRFSESEKDKMPPSLYIDPTKRRIRARSESEPNDISNMRYWTHPDELDIRQEDKIFKRNDDQQIQINERTINYNLPSPPPLSQKRESPSRVLIYNQNLNSNSGALKKPNRFRSHSVLSPTRSSGARRCKTKSPSPTFRGKSFSPVSPFRKSKSATLPSRTTALPERIAASTKPTQITDYIKINPIDDDSFLEDEDDLEEGAENDNCEESSSSDSEDGYKVHAYGDHADKSPTPIQLGSQTLIAVRPSSLFIPSLFPNVPPHLAFSTHEEKGPPVPPELYKVLKWKLTSVMPRVVRSVLINSGFRLLKKTHEWMGTWGKHMKSPCFKAIRPYQKINHLPGSFKLGRKDACWKNLQKKMVKFGKKEFGFMPKTYIIPQDLKALRKAWPRYSHRNFKWIIKPPASARGTGIKVINRWSQIPKRKPVIVQRYIEKPLLINGSKFDLRLYVLITSMNPLRVYMYHDGLVRFASVKYSERSDTLNDRCMHLTNYSINKYSSHYSKNEDVNACHGHKWTLKSLWSYFNSRGINTGRLWAALRNLVLRTILSAENTITGMVKLNLESKYSCFELFGFDVILDSELVPWLLEVNISPSLHSELPLDIHVKAPLVQAVLNTALYNVPPKLSAEQQKDILNKEGLQGSLCYDKRLYINYLSREEKLKHHEFTRKDLEDREEYLNAILHDLTPDDVRCLIVTEDEFSRCFPLERIFPTQYSHKYLKYTESPRYYNRLLDAWEHRYAKNRNAGIRLLRELCANKYHLEVPPAPVKRDSNDETNNNKCNESGMDAKDNNKINKTEKSDQTSPAATLERIQQIVKSANNKYPYGRNNKCFSIKSTVNINSAKNREILGDDDNLETIEITTKFFLSSKDDGFND